MSRLCISITMVLITMAPGAPGVWLSAANSRTESTVSASSRTAGAADWTESSSSSSQPENFAKRADVGQTSLTTDFGLAASRLRRGCQRIITMLAGRIALTSEVGQRVAAHSPLILSARMSTSASFSFSGTSSEAESLGETTTTGAAPPSAASSRNAITRGDGNRIGGIEATRSPLIEMSAGSVSPRTASSRVDRLQVVTATVNTLESSVVAIGKRLSATPIVAMFGFGGDHAAESGNNSAPSSGNGGKTPPPASPTAVLTTPLALTLVAPRVTYAQISTVLAEITLSIYVPPG